LAAETFVKQTNWKFTQLFVPRILIQLFV